MKRLAVKNEKLVECFEDINNTLDYQFVNADSNIKDDEAFLSVQFNVDDIITLIKNLCEKNGCYVVGEDYSELDTINFYIKELEE